jgi:hypothetical protein
MQGNTRGPLRGSRPNGCFTGGEDPRRYKHDVERRKARMTIEELAKQYTTEAFNKLAELMQSDNPKLSMEAATQILDRGHGKSVDRIAIAQVGGQEGTSGASLSLDDLRARASRLLDETPTDIEYDQ